MALIWLGWVGLDFVGLAWIGLDWIELDWVGLDRVWCHPRPGPKCAIHFTSSSITYLGKFPPGAP